MKVRSRVSVWILYTVLMPFLLLYLPCMLLYRVHPGQWWPMGILSVGFPLLWIFCGLLAGAAFFIHRRTGWWLTALFVLGIFAGKNVIAWNTGATWQMARHPKALRVMQWNCGNMPGDDPGFETWRHADRKAAVEFIRAAAPDIICLQDFSTYDSNAHLRSNLKLFTDTLGYKHYQFDNHFGGSKPWGKYRAGIAIFSKIPLLAFGRVAFDDRPYPESILYTDLAWQGRRLRMVTTHLASMHLNWSKNLVLNDYQKPDSAIIASENKIRKLRYFQPRHVRQARKVRQFMDSCRLPVVLSADLNSMPSSWVYSHIKGSLKDAFLAGGRGAGKSFKSWVPFLRIDYLFCSPEVQVLQCATFPGANSDHLLVLADLIFP